MTQTFRAGDRVVIGRTNSLAEKYTGKAGTCRGRGDNAGIMVQLDSEESRPRYFYFSTLRPEKTTMNIKQLAKDTVTNFIAKIGGDKDATVQELLVATSLASATDARKKKAKEAIIKDGIALSEYRPGEVEAYRSAKYVLVAKTKEPTSKLDPELLRAKLAEAGLSKAKIDRAFAAATTDNKPATSYEVTQL